MPRNVRNFWVDLSVDGRKSDVGTGPRAKDGGMIARFYIRDKGEVKNAVTVRCYERDGTLTLVVHSIASQYEDEGYANPVVIKTER